MSGRMTRWQSRHSTRSAALCGSAHERVRLRDGLRRGACPMLPARAADGSDAWRELISGLAARSVSLLAGVSVVARME
jgi:hypothetical protein